LHRVDETDIPADFQAARSSFSENETSVVRVLDDETLGAYMLVKSIDGSPAFVLGIAEPREVHAQTQQSTFYVLYLLLGFGVLFSVLLFFGVDAAVLSRVRRLSNSVYAVNKNQSSSERLSVGGKDEVTAVAEAVNKTLTSLERSQRDLAESKARNQALVETIPDLVFAVDQEGRFTKIGRSQEWDLSDEMISLISTQIREMAMPHVTTALVSRQTQVFRFQLTIDGRESYHEARVSASSDHDALMLVRDVTERELGGQERRNALLVEKIYDRVKSLHSSLQSAASGKCGSRVEEDTPSCPEPTDRSQQDADTGGVNWSSGGSTIESEPASTTANAMAQRER
jgi:PAS domain-containing protein